MTAKLFLVAISFIEFDRATLLMAFNYMYLNAFSEYGTKQEMLDHCLPQLIDVADVLNRLAIDDHHHPNYHPLPGGFIPLALLAKAALRQSLSPNTVIVGFLLVHSLTSLI